MSLGAPHMEKPVWGGASGLLLMACAEGRAVQWIICSPMRARGTDGEGMRCCALCPPHSTAQAAACRFVKESGAGGRWSRVRWEQRALRTPSPLLLRRERVRWWGTAVGSAPEAIDTVVSREEAWRQVSLYIYVNLHLQPV